MERSSNVLMLPILAALGCITITSSVWWLLLRNAGVPLYTTVLFVAATFITLLIPFGYQTALAHKVVEHFSKVNKCEKCTCLITSEKLKTLISAIDHAPNGVALPDETVELITELKSASRIITEARMLVERLEKDPQITDLLKTNKAH